LYKLFRNNKFQRVLSSLLIYEHVSILGVIEDLITTDLIRVATPETVSLQAVKAVVFDL